MKRTEIIKTFLDRGFQITGSALDFFIENPDKLDQFFSKNSHHQPTITLENIKEVLETPTPPQLVKFFKTIEKASISDFSDFFNRRYTTLERVLNKRLDLVNLVSINKISEKIKKFSIIGMIKEKDAENKKIVIEDRTGEIEIVLPENLLKQLVEDEVVGVVCEKNDGFHGEKLVFPDIPLQREINKTKEENRIFVVSDLHMDSALFNKNAYEKLIAWLGEQPKLTIFVLGDISTNKEDVLNFLSLIPKTHETHIINGEIDTELSRTTLPNPGFVQIENVKLFLFHNKKINEYMNFWSTPEQTIINLIKKRHLDPTFSLDSKIYDNDPYLLDIIPDVIVAAHTHTPSIANYKGITILTTGSFITQPIFWLMDLRTRETFKKDFS